MKLFEFDIAWDQAINHFFDQDDCKHIGSRRVESDNVRIVAPTKELAQHALESSMSGRNLVIRTPVREVPIHQWVTYERKTLAAVDVTRVVGPEALSPFGERMKQSGMV